MSSIIEKARKGNRFAMTQLVEANKAQIYSLCRALMCDETEANNGTVLVFRQLWEPVMTGKLLSEQAVTEFLVKRAIGHCKTRLLRRDAKAFRAPVNKDFSAFTCSQSAIRSGAEPDEQILESLPPLHRMIYVLSGALELSNAAVGQLVGLSPDLVEQALAAEEGNLTRILTTRQKKLGESLSLTPGEFHEALRKKARSRTTPAAVDASIQSGLDAVVQPLEQKAKKRKVMIPAVLAACLMVAILVFAIRGLADGGQAVTDETFGLTSANGTSSDTSATGSTEETDPADDDITTTTFNTEMQAVTGYADIEIEGYGTITVALDGISAPETVANFAALAERGFYDGLTFHRIQDGFMMQGGDPNGNGTGGAENTITGEFSANGVENPLSHVAGAISMARSSDPNSASSQFFIVHEDSTFLDGDYAVFGYVIEGMEIVDAICTSASPTDSKGTIPANEQPVITSITIRMTDDMTVVTSSGVVDISVDPTTGQTGDLSEDPTTDQTVESTEDPTVVPTEDERTGG